MSSPCKRRLELVRTIIGAGPLTVTIPADVADFTMRCVTNAGVAVAFTVTPRGEPAGFHFAVDEAWSVDRLNIDDPIEVDVDTATATDVVELLLWRG